MFALPSALRPFRRLVAVVVLGGLGVALAQETPAKKTTPQEATPGDNANSLQGHQETVYGVALNHDGNLALTASFDKTVKLWDVLSRKEIRTFGGPNGHQSLVLGVAFAPDGQSFASCAADSTVKTWDVPQARPLRDLAMADAVTAVAVSADGKSTAAGGKDGAIKLWNAADAKESFRLTGHVGPVTGLAYAANGQLLASTGTDATLRFWNPATGQVIAVVGAHTSPIHAVALAPAGNAAYTAAADGTVKVWQLPPVASRPLAGHQDTVRAIATSSDGNTVATGSLDKSVRVFNSDNGQVQKTLTAPQPVTAVGFFGSGNNAVTAAGTTTGHLIVWGADGKPTFQTQAHGDELTGISVHPNGTQLLTSGADGNLIAWGLPMLPTKTLVHPSEVRAALISPDGKRVLTGGGDNQMRIWTVANAQIERPFAGHAKPVTAVAMSADGNTVASASADDVRVWRRDNGQQTAQLPAQAGVAAVALHPNGSQVLVAHEDGTLKLWPLPLPMKDAKPVWTAKAATVRKVVFDPRGERVLTVGKDAALRLWDAKAGKEAKTMSAHDGEILDLAVTADGTKAVTSGPDKTVKVWNPADQKLLATVTLPSPAVRIAINATGTRLAIARTGGKGQQVFVHDAATGRALMAIDGEYTAVTSLAFAPDNRGVMIAADKGVILADVPVANVLTTHAGGVCNVVYHNNGTQAFAAGADKTVKLWDLTTGKEVRTFATLPDAVSAVAVSRDYSLVAAAAGKQVTVWNVADGKGTHTLTHPAAVISLGFNGDKSRIATGTTDNQARLWDLTTSKELQSFSHGAAVHSVALHPGKPAVVVAGSADKTAVVHTATVQRTIVASPNPVRALVVAPSGQLVIGGDDKIVKLWNPANPTPERTFGGANDAVLAVAVSKNNALLAAAGADKVVRIYNFNDGNLLGSFPAPGVVRSLNFHPNNQVLLSAGDDRAVTAWNIVVQPGNPPPPEFGKPVQSFPHTAAVLAATYSADGNSLVSAGDGKSAHVWKVAADAPTRNFQHPNLVDAVAYNKDGSQLATACHDGIVRLFDTIKNAPIRQINAHIQPTPQPVYAVVWSPDNKQIASASLDRSIKIWDAANGNLVREIKGYDEKTNPKGHRDGVFTLAFTLDGQFIISGSSDRSIRVWKVADGTPVRDFVNPNIPASMGQPAAAHPGWVQHLRLMPDGKSVVSVGGAPKNRGFVAVWNIADGKLLGSADLPLGPFNAVAVAPDGLTLCVACGPRGRIDPQADAVILKVPGK